MELIKSSKFKKNYFSTLGDKKSHPLTHAWVIILRIEAEPDDWFVLSFNCLLAFETVSRYEKNVINIDFEMHVRIGGGV